MFYSERKDELVINPQLAVYSSPSPDKRRSLLNNTSTASKQEAGAVVLDFAEAKETEEDDIPGITATGDIAAAQQPLVNLTGSKRKRGAKGELVSAGEGTVSAADRTTRRRKNTQA